MSYHAGSLRTTRLSTIALFLLAILLANLFRMQILKGPYYRKLSEKNRVRVIYLEGARGKILDRNGKPLATNRLSFNCSAIPREAKADIEHSLDVVSGILGENRSALAQRFKRKKPGLFSSVVLAEDISPDKAMAVEQRLDELPGFAVETRPQRVYPYNDSAAHLLGFIGPMDPDEADSLEAFGYSGPDWVGRDGVEKSYENYLHGRSGGLQMEVNNRGRFVRALGVKEPLEGRDLRLTVDAELQHFVQGLLGSQRGAVAVMELKDGGLLSINSAPSFDPNRFSSARGRKTVDVYLSDERAPMVNRNLRGQYPAGSIFKIVTAFAGMETKKISPRSAFRCDGFVTVGGIRFHCWKEEGHGEQGMTEAFAHSCNVFFYNAGLQSGVDAIARKAADFGFSKATGVDLPGEKTGFVPTREWKRRSRHETWFDGETANLSIGQGYLQVTPIQALSMVAAVATGGEQFVPHVLEDVSGVSAHMRKNKRIRMEPASLAAVRKGLTAAVQSDTGTGRLARVEGVTVAAKTGTAQSGQDRTHAWFVGYAPAENPKVALVVFVENGGKGGVAAAQIAGPIVGWLKEAGYL